MSKKVTTQANVAGPAIHAVPMFSELVERGRMDIVQFTKDFINFPPPIESLHPGQVKWAHNFIWTPERMIGCANRWGKTTVAAVKLLHHAFFQTRLPQYSELTHDYTAISLSITLDMAQIAWNFAVMLAQNSPLLKRFIVDIKKRDPFPLLVLGDGDKWRSEIWARSTANKGVYLLGRAFDFVNWDEAAREPGGRFILDDVLRMRMADRQGRLDMTSTGAGKNWFWKQCELGRKNGPYHLQYYFQTGSTYENPSISVDRLEDAKGRMSEAMVKQNIYGEFIDFATVFPIADIEQCYRGIDYSLIRTPDQAQREITTFPRDASFVFGVDLGRKRDPTVILGSRTDISPAHIVYAQEIGNEEHWDGIYDAISKVYHTFRDPLTVIDATSLGGDISVDILRGERYNVHNIIPYSFAGRGGSQKEHLIQVGQMALQQKAIIWPYIPELYDQLGMYDYKDVHLATDWVMAYCMMAEGIRQSSTTHIQIAPIEFMIHTLRAEYDDTETRRVHHAFTKDDIELDEMIFPVVFESRVH